MMANNNMKNMNGKPGRGMGQGIGIGARPEEKNNTNLRDTQVRTNPKRGAATFGGFVEGPNIKGDVGQNIKEEMASLGAEPADPLTSERLPNSRREHAEQYFQNAPRRQIGRFISLPPEVRKLPKPLRQAHFSTNGAPCVGWTIPRQFA